MSNQPFRCSLELDTSTTPFSGRLLTPGGEPSIEFAGWVGLASALDGLLTEATVADGGANHSAATSGGAEINQEG